MKTSHLLLWIITISTIVMLSTGCNQTPTSEDKTKIDTLASQTNSATGMTELETALFTLSTITVNGTNDLDRIDFSKANTYFKKALVDNPSNLDANFGAAMTEVFLVYNDSEINDALKQWEAFDPSNSTALSSLRSFGIPTGTKNMTVPISSLGADLVQIIRQAKTDPPSIAQMQNLLKNKFLPRINYALERLAVIEQHSDFQLKITGKMQGNLNASPVNMDLTEIYLLDAMVQGIKAAVSQFLVFQFSLPSYTVKDVVKAIDQDNTSFFVLATDGRAHSANVKNGMLNMISKIRSGIDFLKAETDAQSDDIIKLNSTGKNSVVTKDLDTALAYLKKAEDALKTGFSINVKGADSVGNDYTLEVHLYKLFDNPPNNPKKEWLPPYTVDTTANGKDILFRWTQKDYLSFKFPDPTLGGVFPKMTNDMLKRLLEIDEEFAWKVYLNVNNYDQASLATMSARLQVGAKSYFHKQNRWSNSDPVWWGGRDFRFFVVDQTVGNAQVFVTLNGVEKELSFNQQIQVSPKEYTYMNANVTPAPQNVTVKMDSIYTYYPFYGYQKIIKVSFARNSDYYYSNYYNIDRDSTSTGFLPYAKEYFSSEYLNGEYYFYYRDMNFVAKKTYKYRLSPLYTDYYWGYLPDNYSNTVIITTP